MQFQSPLSLYQCTLLPICTVATVQLLYAIPILSLYQCTLLPICTVATVQLLYAIPIPTVTISVHTVTNMYGSHSTVTVCNSNPVTISVHTVTNMYGSHSTVTVCNSNPHCHCISAHCY